MTGAAKILFLAGVISIACVNGLIDTKRFEKNPYFIRRATYSEVIQALFTVDFNLSPEESSNIEHFVLREKSEHVMKTISKMKDAVKVIANVKLPEPVLERGSLTNAAWLIINYDVMGQILDPKLKTSFFSLFGEHDDIETRLLDMLDQRWKVGFTGTGLVNGKTGVKSVRDLEKIMMEEKMAERVREDVFKMYEQLDDFVIKANNDAQVPLYPIIPPNASSVG